jgi:hypothetical protein
MGSETGSKWIIGLLIYFAVLTTVMVLITYTAGGNVDTGLDQYKVNTCSSPRYIYEPYNANPIYHTQMTQNELNSAGIRGIVAEKSVNKEAHLNCMMSYGVTSEDNCLTINGCAWNTTGLTWYQNLFKWFPGYNPEEPEPTCLGSINATSYDIEYRTVFGSGGENVVIEHENSYISYNMGSICTHPKVLNDETLCELFSCTWMTKEKISELEIEKINFSPSIIKTTWGIISEMFTFRFDWGFENPIGNYMATFFTYWIPLIMLLFALYMLVRG